MMKFVVYFSPCFFNFHRDSTIQPNNSGTMRIYIYIYMYLYIYIAMATGPFKGHIPVLNKNCANRYVKSPEGFIPLEYWYTIWSFAFLLGVNGFKVVGAHPYKCPVIAVLKTKMKRRKRGLGNDFLKSETAVSASMRVVVCKRCRTHQDSFRQPSATICE